MAIMFGWARLFDRDELQNATNNGSVCIVSGQQIDLNRPGHICAVVPETPMHSAVRNNGAVTIPLQSQAGLSNFRYGGSVWWTQSKFRAFGFWVHG